MFCTAAYADDISLTASFAMQVVLYDPFVQEGADAPALAAAEVTDADVGGSAEVVIAFDLLGSDDASTLGDEDWLSLMSGLLSDAVADGSLSSAIATAVAEAGDDVSGLAGAEVTSSETTDGSDGSSGGSGWVFGDDATTGAGIVIVLQDEESGSVHNSSIGCGDDDDDAVWDFDWQLEDGGYSLEITSCGGGDSTSISSGDLSPWLGADVSVVCDGLPCSLTFYAEEGSILHSPTVAPTPAPTLSCTDDVAAGRYVWR